ncbi:MAG: glycerophosphodiester phosphodiesterase family protein [Leadbetterella sp.]|nr:glycerophosphodiester phosphodiesterase family protein [Leadbetterella sp.]
MRKSLYLLFFLALFTACRSTRTFIPEPRSAFTYFSAGNTHFPMVSVHRGGGEIPGYPENCLESFEHFARLMPCIIECDIAMSKDSVLYMMHDNTLERTTTGTGKTSERDLAYLQSVYIKDNFGTVTPYRIPTLDQALQWGKNKVLFTLDVKRGTPFEKVVESVRKARAENSSVIITYNATDAGKVYGLAPELMISVTIMKPEDYERLHQLGIPDRNMVAFIGVNEPDKALIEFLHAKGIPVILGVLGNLDKKAAAQGDKVYKNYIDLGVDILSTDRPEAVYSVIKP